MINVNKEWISALIVLQISLLLFDIPEILPGLDV